MQKIEKTLIINITNQEFLEKTLLETQNNNTEYSDCITILNGLDIEKLYKIKPLLNNCDFVSYNKLFFYEILKLVLINTTRYKKYHFKIANSNLPYNYIEKVENVVGKNNPLVFTHLEEVGKQGLFINSIIQDIFDYYIPTEYYDMNLMDDILLKTLSIINDSYDIEATVPKQLNCLHIATKINAVSEDFIKSIFQDDKRFEYYIQDLLKMLMLTGKVPNSVWFHIASETITSLLVLERNNNFPKHYREMFMGFVNSLNEDEIGTLKSSMIQNEYIKTGHRRAIEKLMKEEINRFDDIFKPFTQYNIVKYIVENDGWKDNEK